MLNGRYGSGRFHDVDVKAAFGLDPKAKWPEGGLPRRTVQGVTMWVDPLYPGVGRLRARCLCPKCGSIFATGRLNQHAKVHK